MEWTHLVTLEVTGRPANVATTHVEAWTEAVRDAVDSSGTEVVEGRFSVRMEFRLTPSSRINDAEDLHHLVGPTLDGLVGGTV